MKKTLATTFAMMMFAIAAVAPAHADDRNNLFRFDFKCEFDRDDMTPSSPREEIEVQARVFAELRHMNATDGATIKNSKNLDNLIAAEFDDSLIVAESAVLNSTQRFVQITGVSGSPSLIIPRKHDISTEWMRYEAFLKFGDRKPLRGECNVRAVEVKDRDLN